MAASTARTSQGRGGGRPWPRARGLAGYRLARATLLGVAVLGPACSGTLGEIEPTAGTPGPCCGDAEVTARYLGVGGWLIRRGDAVLLTAPFYSNPGLFTVGLWSLRPDTIAIDRYAAQVPGMEDAVAVLVGHGHYDHLMDVPRILERHAPRALAYGSATVSHELAGAGIPRGRRVAVDAMAGSAEANGRWITVAGGAIRFMPLRSGHAPHWWKVELYEGAYDRDLREPPLWAWDWVEGQTYAYLIDFLDPDGRVAFRIHYQDSASQAPEGLIPPLPPGDRHPVDLTILCAPSFNWVRGYPERILEQATPGYALVGHWEDFFEPPTTDPGAVATLDLPQFVRRMRNALPEGSLWSVPRPGALFRFPPADPAREGWSRAGS